MSESSTSMGCIVVDSLDGPAGLSVGTIEKICSTVLCSHLSADYTGRISWAELTWTFHPFSRSKRSSPSREAELSDAVTVKSCSSAELCSGVSDIACSELVRVQD